MRPFIENVCQFASKEHPKIHMESTHITYMKWRHLSLKWLQQTWRFINIIFFGSLSLSNSDEGRMSLFVVLRDMWVPNIWCMCMGTRAKCLEDESDREQTTTDEVRASRSDNKIRVSFSWFVGWKCVSDDCLSLGPGIVGNCFLRSKCVHFASTCVLVLLLST